MWIQPESYCGFGNVVQCKRVLNEDFSSTRKLIRENRRYFRVDNPTIPFGKIETGVLTSQRCNEDQKQNLKMWEVAAFRSIRTLAINLQPEGNFSRFLTFFSLQSAASLNNFLRTGLPFPLQQKSEMKVPPISLPNGMDRIPLPLPFSPGRRSTQCWLHSTTITCNLYLPSAMLRIYICQICCGATQTLSWPSRHPRPSRPKWRVGCQVNFLLNHSRTSILIMLQLRNFFHSDHETLEIENQTTRVK